ncbi:helix-turn-helix domain-containing protein [Nocardioides nitrophenolicus]|uniref:helix-turn-helix domain-containing protein n=1 Tax=Nocardioides nitrophenolicus TaxID=60489 RepID=UPI00195E8E7F|nr:helix-turn-helix transcriptional regulator [Nocardioides nitrophenolicus]MBM7515819.1 transcriptional regulator with XRE-family HTH domain [Nocardioides nitrophenolicus]
MSHIDARWAQLLGTVDPAVLGSRVRAARVARGLNQADLVGEAYSVGYVSRIESGARRPTLAALTVISERLGVDVAELVAGASEAEVDEIRLGLSYAELALENGEAVDAERQARAALARAEGVSVTDLTVRGRFVVARSLEVTGRLDDAIRELESLLADVGGVAAIKCGIALSRCYREAGDLALAIEVGERIQPEIVASGLERTDEAVQLAMTVALAHIERGDLSRATRICTDAIALAEEMASPVARSAAYWNASIAYSERGETQSALTLATRALALLGEGQDARNLAYLRLELGRLHLGSESPDVETAIKHVTKAADELQSSSGSTAQVAHAQTILARALVMDGQADEALDVATAARAGTPKEASLGAAEAAMAQAEALAELGRDDEAVEACREAAELLSRRTEADRWVAQAWCELADLFEYLGEVAAAHAAIKSAASASGLRLRARAGRAQRPVRVS